MTHARRAIFTIPNLLSAFRLLLAGLIAGLYRAGDVPGAACAFLLSVATDGADGYFARKYHMVSDLLARCSIRGRQADAGRDALAAGKPLRMVAFVRSHGVLAKEAYMAAWGVFMVRRLGRPLSALVRQGRHGGSVRRRGHSSSLAAGRGTLSAA